MKIPGVDYHLLPGALSYAGGAHGFPPVLINQAVTFTGSEPNLSELMERRYGPHRTAGVPGPHENVYADHMREAFAAGNAAWTSATLATHDGKPTLMEVSDAYYSADARCRPVATRPPVPPPTPPPPQPPAPVKPPILPASLLKEAAIVLGWPSIWGPGRVARAKRLLTAIEALRRP